MPGKARRITFITNGYPLGGAETQVVRLATALEQRGDVVKVMSLLPNPELVDRLSPAAVPVDVVRIRKPLQGLTAVLSGTRLVLKQRPSVLLCFDYQSIVLGRLAGRVASVPVVVSSIRNERFGGRTRELLIRATDRLASITVTNSQIVAADLSKRRIVKNGRITVIPNGIDLSAYGHVSDVRGEARKRLRIGEHDFAWLAAGRLWPQKDYPTTLRAFARWAGCRPGGRLIIAGEGPLLISLESLARDLGVVDQVTFLGEVADLRPALSAADALVLSSAWEGLPNVIMEAMASGLPVVATNVGGVPELVTPGVTGLLVEPRNPEALAAAMASLSAMDEPQRRALGAAGRKAIEAGYGLDAVTKQWSDLIDMYLQRVETKGDHSDLEA